MVDRSSPGTIDPYSFNAGIEAAAGLCEVPVKPFDEGETEPAAPIHARWIRQAKLNNAAPHSSAASEEVQDTWLVGGPPDLKAMSGSVESDRVIQLHFRRKATDADRAWLLEAINAKIAADKAGIGDVAQPPTKPTEDQIMKIIRKVTRGSLREMLTCKDWKDGIDIDRPTFAAKRLAEEFRALVVPSMEGK